MGACYTTVFRVKAKDETTAADAMRRWMHDMEDAGFARFSLDAHRAEGVVPDTIDGVIMVVLAGWRNTPFRTTGPDADGFTTYENDFEASYGWGMVLLEFAAALAPHLEDGSSFYIEPDDEYHDIVTIDGKLINRQNI